jgi:hypothetical protein
MLLTTDSLGYGEEEARLCIEHNDKDKISAILFATKDIQEEDIIAVMTAHDLRMWAAVFLAMAVTCEKYEEK